VKNYEKKKKYHGKVMNWIIRKKKWNEWMNENLKKLHKIKKCMTNIKKNNLIEMIWKKKWKINKKMKLFEINYNEAKMIHGKLWKINKNGNTI